MNKEHENKEITDIKERIKKARAGIIDLMRTYKPEERDRECTTVIMISYIYLGIITGEERVRILHAHNEWLSHMLSDMLCMMDDCIANGLLDDAKSDDFVLNHFVSSVIDHVIGQDNDDSDKRTDRQKAYIEKFEALDDDTRQEVVKMLSAACAAIYRVRYEHWTNSQMVQHVEQHETLPEFVSSVVTYDWALNEGIKVLLYMNVDNLDPEEMDDAKVSDITDRLKQSANIALPQFLDILDEKLLPASREWIRQFLADHKEGAEMVFVATMAMYGMIPRGGFDLNEKIGDKEWVSHIFDVMNESFFGETIRSHTADESLRPGFIYAMWVSLYVCLHSEAMGAPLLCGRGEAVDALVRCGAEAINKRAGK